MIQEVVKSADEFITVIKDIIRQELNKKDNTILCRVVSINENGSVNVYIEPDEQNIIRNISNNLSFDLNNGDYIYVYKINNQLSNSFVLNKVGCYSTKNKNYTNSLNKIETNINSELQRLLDGKQDKLIAGNNISIVNNVISAFGGGGTQNYDDLLNAPIINLYEPYNSCESIEIVLYYMAVDNRLNGLYKVIISQGSYLINYKPDPENSYAVIYGENGFTKYKKTDSVFTKEEDLYEKLTDGTDRVSENDINDLI